MRRSASALARLALVKSSVLRMLNRADEAISLAWRAYGEAPAGGFLNDHVHPWAAGGATTGANGRVACGFHNRQRHRAPP